MRYWFYSDGNILGPYGADELMGLPAFSNGSLVCPEDSTGDNPDDWKPAEAVPEIAGILSVGVGQVISSENAYISNAYNLETGFSTRAAQEYFDAKNENWAAGGNLLDTIDTILGAYAQGGKKENEIPGIDYSLADKFDVKLAKLQEELEASKWEKNLLLEKMKIKDAEEKINKEKISELEKKLNDVISRMESKIVSTEASSGEISQEDAHKADADERLRKEQEAIDNEFELETKTEDISRSRNISDLVSDHVLEVKKFFDRSEYAPDTDHILSNKLESLGYAKSKKIFGDDYSNETDNLKRNEEKEDFSRTEQKDLQDDSKNDKRNSDAPSATAIHYDFGGQASAGSPSSNGEYGAIQYVESYMPAEASAPAGADDRNDCSISKKSEDENIVEPEFENSLDIQPSAMMYDFTTVTQKHHSSRHKKNTITLEENKESSIQPNTQAEREGPEFRQYKPATAEQALADNPVVASGGALKAEPEIKKEKLSSPKSSFDADPFMHPETVIPKKEAQEIKPASESVLTGLKPTETDADKDLTTNNKDGAIREASLEDKTERILLKSKQDDKPVKTEAPKKNKTKKSGILFLTVMIIFGAIVAAGLGFFFFNNGLSLSDFSLMSFFSNKRASSSQEPAVEKTQAKPEAPAEIKTVVSSSNENVRTAIDIVKSHKLAGGRGLIATWLSNSFLSGSSVGLNEEWSATILHKDVFVTQYRLLRQRKEPVVYQFEVDVKKGEIVRGINNSAIELLDFPSKNKTVKKPVSKEPAKEAKSQPKKKRLNILPQLPLPAPPAKDFKHKEPSGFENITLSASDKVKYIRAQESDEELF
ncbi:MAG: hypothetical protein L6420_01880 [Elusimicrobia bacterium]|nr:hypothetical protein [Elusimicrobiota bacterium]